MQYPKDLEHDAGEWAWTLEKIAGKTSLLEIGSRYGNGLRSMASVLAPGARIRAIDHGQPSGECPYATAAPLRATAADLRKLGFDADVLCCDSHEREALEWAKQHGPYDVVVIDGDHSYTGARQDWEWYGPLGKLVVIDGMAVDFVGDGVRQLWKEIEASGAITQECIKTFGMGIVRRETVATAIAA